MVVSAIKVSQKNVSGDKKQKLVKYIKKVLRNAKKLQRTCSVRFWYLAIRVKMRQF